MNEVIKTINKLIREIDNSEYEDYIKSAKKNILRVLKIKLKSEKKEWIN